MNISEMNTQELNAKSAALSNGISNLQQEMNTLIEMQKEVAIRKGELGESCSYEYVVYNMNNVLVESVVFDDDVIKSEIELYFETNGMYHVVK